MNRSELLQEVKNTPVVLLAGGYGTRIAEETHLVPKPMIDLRGVPIIVHIMDFYSNYGFSNFVICGGYKIEVLKNYFINLPLIGHDVEVQFSRDSRAVVTASQSKYMNAGRQDWKVTILETGLNAMTGSRLRKALEYVSDRGHERVCVTYGDGLSDVDLHQEYLFHRKHGKTGTVLGVHNPTRFGILHHNSDSTVTSFSEKPQTREEYINGGYFIFETRFLKSLPAGDETSVLERQPLESLAAAGDLKMFAHSGFWQCMDTIREKKILEDYLDRNEAPWKRVLREK